MRVVSTSSLPIALAIPNARVEIPEEFVGVARCDLSTADALICLLLDRIDAAVLARAPKLRVVANCAVGYDNVDVAACTAAGVAVTNTPDVLTEATAEFAFALMLAAARRLPEGERLARSGAWPGWRLDQLLGVELAGKTLGIVGMGRIGRAVARRAEAFGMHVIAAGERGVSIERSSSAGPRSAPEGERGVSIERSSSAGPRSAPEGERGVSIERSSSAGPRSAPEGERGVSIDELFARADVVSLHCPLTPATRGLVDARRLALMKPTAILVNTARGGCVDEAALVDALRAGRLFAAALDVYAREPEIDPRLVDCPRLILAPHIGSATTETRTKMSELCRDAVIDVLAGRRPRHLVNPEVVIRG